MPGIRRRGGWAALLTAVTLVTSVIAGGTHAAPNSTAIAPAAKSETATADGATLFVAPRAPVFTQNDARFEFSVLLRNEGKRSVPEGSVEISLGPRVDATATDRAAGGIVRTVLATEQLDAVAPGESREITIVIPAAEFPLTNTSDAGVYEVFANFVAGNSSSDLSLNSVSPLIWKSAAVKAGSTPQMDLSMIVPFVLPTRISTMPSTDDLADLAPQFDALLDTATRVRATLAIDPRIIAAIRAYGTEAPQSAQDFLARLEHSSLPSFTLQFGDADPAAQAAIGLSELLAPVGFDYVTRLGSFEQTSAAGPDAPAAEAEKPAADSAEDQSSENIDTTPTDDSSADEPSGDDPSAETQGDKGSAAPPSFEELVAWDAGVPASWPASGQVNARTLALVKKFGLTTTIVNSENVVLSKGPRATLSGGNAIVTDAALDAGVKLALAGTSDTERAFGTAQAYARLAEAAELGTGLVLGVDRGGVANNEETAEFLEALTAPTWVRTVEVADQATGTAKLREGVTGEERAGLLKQALENESVVLETRAVLEHPKYLDAYQRLRLLNLFATRYAAADANFRSTAQKFTKRDAALHDGVSIVSTKHAQLVGVSSRIPVQLKNALPFDALVNVSVTPTSAALKLEQRDFPKVVIENGASDRVLVPVRSRVSSGESALLIAVTNTDDDFVAATKIMPISISTKVETIALAVLGAAAVLLFGFGTWRSVRRRRKGIVRT